MRINILQHTPNENAGSILSWADMHQHEVFVYHPYQFNGVLPTVSETDLLIILGGPMSPNDELPWIAQERTLIYDMLQQDKPIFGACFGAQQIAKTLGASVHKAPYKEVGWANVHLMTTTIPNVPEMINVLHWHEEMFDMPENAQLLFSSDLVVNQGFLVKQNVIGLQFHFEPQKNDVREIVINDGSYALECNALSQTPETILQMQMVDFDVNQQVMYTLLDYITSK
ncbi:type 1 glutamine amidotransferase [Weissella minor]|uniref:type 1 glutamine amidotransferase n=1 Tax=Weissella minor TaxID=1620 RepID=UPI001BAF81A1|nr:type 1 glutamine amidotransferase [Weissella minor]MBS0949089.1 type 1 glutamine amidotransferase [Weissella minor]